LSAELGADVDHAEILEDLSAFFDITPFQVNLKDPETEGVRIEKELRNLGQGTTAFAMVLPGGKAYYLRQKANVNLREEMVDPEIHEEVARLDVSVLHQYILPRCGSAIRRWNSTTRIFSTSRMRASRWRCSARRPMPAWFF
jgi:hypothetical protein